MEVWQATVVKKDPRCGTNGGYIPMDDGGERAERSLYIVDDEGRMVVLKNDQIGELYRRIKPMGA